MQTNLIPAFKTISLETLPLPFQKTEPLFSQAEERANPAQLLEPCISPKRTDAISKISNEIMQIYDNLTAEEMLNIKLEIESNVLALKKDKNIHAFEIKNELFVIAKRNKEVDKVIEIIKRTELINDGGFGMVYSAKELNTNKKSEVIKLARDDFKSSIRNAWCHEQLLNEIELLARKNPGGSIKLIQPQPRIVFEYTPIGSKTTKIGYVTDKLDGDFYKLLTNGYPFTHENKLSITKQLQEILQILITSDIYHGDIKPENLLCKCNEDGQMHLLLIDFGCSIEFSQMPLNIAILNKSICGTAKYFSKQIYDKLNDEVDLFKNKFLLDEDIISALKENISVSLKKIKGAKMIDYFNQRIKPFLVQSQRFAIGLVLYMVWTGRVPPFDSFKEHTAKHEFTCTETNRKENRESMEHHLKMNNAPEGVPDLIFEYLNMSRFTAGVVDMVDTSKEKKRNPANRKLSF